jgi:7-keto-8-aminopelargonate synthetase-like enzyme
VPVGSARLRFSLTAALEATDVERALTAVSSSIERSPEWGEESI